MWNKSCIDAFIDVLSDMCCLNFEQVVYERDANKRFMMCFLSDKVNFRDYSSLQLPWQVIRSFVLCLQDLCVM